MTPTNANTTLRATTRPRDRSALARSVLARSVLARSVLARSVLARSVLARFKFADALISAIALLALMANAAPGAAQAAAQAPRAAWKKAVETITESDVRRRIEIIADDSMGGRDTPSKGLEMTAEYIASEFARFGLKPGGANGSFLQRYAVPTYGGARRDSATRTARQATAPNVVGILEGSDPALRHEYVVFSAHMDHVGMNPSAKSDSIWNGADDDASGTAAVVELAEAFAQPGARPKRSLIFLTVSGEEKGLWGSDYFAARPPVDGAKLVANLNIDMVGRNWKDSIVVIGREHSDLGSTLARVNAQHPELGMTAIDDLWPNENFFFRSDHYNFARRGVPALFFFNGTHKDYHQAGDSPDKIDAEKEARIVRLIYYLGAAIADAPERPKWNADSYQRIVEKAYR